MRSFSLALVAAMMLATPALSQLPYTQGASRVEVAGGFDYLHTTRVELCCFGMKGFSGTFAYNHNNNVAGVVDVRSASAGNIAGIGENLRLTTVMVGPRLTLRGKRLSPYAQLLVGLGRGSSNYPVNNGSAWAFSLGGGMDMRIKPHISWRVIEVTDLLTQIKNGSNNQQSSVQLSTGIVFGFGDMR
jgi:opacity protein-like surface antigen